MWSWELENGLLGETKQQQSPQPQTIPDRCERGAEHRSPLGLPKSLRDGPGEPPPEATEPLGGGHRAREGSNGAAAAGPEPPEGAACLRNAPAAALPGGDGARSHPPGGLQEAGGGC